MTAIINKFLLNLLYYDYFKIYLYIYIQSIDYYNILKVTI